MRVITIAALAFVSQLIVPTGPRALAASKSGIETSYISDDFVAVWVYHPRQFLTSKLVKQAIAEWDKVEKKRTTAKMFAEVKRELGVDPLQVRQFAMLMDRDLVRGLPMAMGLPVAGGGADGGAAGGAGRGMPATPIFSFIVRFESPVDQKAVTRKAIEMLREARMGVTRRPGLKKKPDAKDAKEPAKPRDVLDDTTVRKHSGKSYRVLESMGICFVDDTTLLVSHESLLKRMIDAKDAKSPLLTQLATLPPKQDFIVAADFKPFHELVKTIAGLVGGFGGGVPPEVSKLFDNLGKMNTVALTAGIDGKTLAFGTAGMPDKASATDFAKLINDKFLSQIKAVWKMGRAEMLREKSPIWTTVAQIIDETLAGVTVAAKGTELRVSVDRPKSLDKLPALALPITKKAKEAAEQASRRNNFKQIGLAFHNYHDVYSSFPGHGANADGTKKGLSWRVHILPFLEQSKLYEQFKLDEPWDSKHNRKLIAKMPAIFKTPGVKDKGKTAIHVFTGKKTPFGAKTSGPRLRDITDGTSNTILCVEAGPDKAAVWTKPGGLEFDPKKDPLKLLGKVPNKVVLTLFMDGHVRFVSTSIKKRVLKLLIQHQDGQPIGGF